jgi:hypothetical protein
MAKKTIEVAEVLEFCNNLNKRFPNNSESHNAFREGVNAVIDHILMRTDNYEGFRLSDGQAKTNETPHYYFQSKLIIEQYKQFENERENGQGVR